jgi:hypothetical protein
MIEMTTAVQARPVDEQKLMAFVFKAVDDFGAIMSGTLVAVGDKLGLFKAIADAGSVTSADLAKRSGCAERYVREWLAAMAASGNITYEGGGRYSLTPEQEVFFTHTESPAGLVGGYQITTAATRSYGRILEAFRTGQGVGWHEQDAELFEGTERFFRPGYIGDLIANWLPALDGVVARLEQGIRVADVGCGHGASTILMAEAFPNSQFFGFDYHQGSIDAARIARRTPASRTSRSRSPPRRSTRARTTSSATSTACTTWATQRARPRTRTSRSTPAARGCSSSRTRRTTSPTT